MRSKLMHKLHKSDLMRTTTVRFLLPAPMPPGVGEQHVLRDILPYSYTPAGLELLLGRTDVLDAFAEFPAAPVPLGRVHIGAATKESTGGHFHFSAQLYPTIERVQLDLDKDKNSVVAEWNAAMLTHVGVLMRTLYEHTCALAVDNGRGRSYVVVSREKWSHVLALLVTLSVHPSKNASVKRHLHLLAKGFLTVPFLRLPVMYKEQLAVAVAHDTLLDTPSWLHALLHAPFLPRQVCTLASTLLHALQPSMQAVQLPEELHLAVDLHRLTHVSVHQLCQKLQEHPLSVDDARSFFHFVAAYLSADDAVVVQAGDARGGMLAAGEPTFHVQLSVQDAQHLLSACSIQIEAELVLRKSGADAQVVLPFKGLTQHVVGSSLPAALPLPVKCLPHALSQSLPARLMKVCQWMGPRGQLSEQQWVSAFVAQGDEPLAYFRTPALATPILRWLATTFHMLTSGKRDKLMEFLRQHQCIPAHREEITSKQLSAVAMARPSEVYLPLPGGVNVPGLLHCALPVVCDALSLPQKQAEQPSQHTRQQQQQRHKRTHDKQRSSAAPITIDITSAADRSPSPITSAAVVPIGEGVEVTHLPLSFLKYMGCPPAPLLPLLQAQVSTCNNAHVVNVLLEQDSQQVHQLHNIKLLLGVDASSMVGTHANSSDQEAACAAAGAAAGEASIAKYVAHKLVFPSVAEQLDFPSGLLVLQWSPTAPRLAADTMYYAKLKAMGVREVPRLEFVLALCSAASPTDPTPCAALRFLISHFDTHYRRVYARMLVYWPLPFLPCDPPSKYITMSTHADVANSAPEWLCIAGSTGKTKQLQALGLPTDSATAVSTLSVPVASSRRTRLATAVQAEAQQHPALVEVDEVDSVLCSTAANGVKQVQTAPGQVLLCAPGDIFAAVTPEHACPLFPTLQASVLRMLKKHRVLPSALLVSVKPCLEHALLQVVSHKIITPQSAQGIFTALHSLHAVDPNFKGMVLKQQLEFVPVLHMDGSSYKLHTCSYIFVQPGFVAFDSNSDSTSGAASSEQHSSGKRSSSTHSSPRKRIKHAAESSAESECVCAGDAGGADVVQEVLSALSHRPGLLDVVDFGAAGNEFLMECSKQTEARVPVLAWLNGLYQRGLAWLRIGHEAGDLPERLRVYAHCLRVVEDGWKASSKADKDTMLSWLRNKDNPLLLAARSLKPLAETQAGVGLGAAAAAEPAVAEAGSSSSAATVIGVLGAMEYALLPAPLISLVGSTEERQLAQLLRPWQRAAHTSHAEDRFLYAEAGAQWLANAVQVVPHPGPAHKSSGDTAPLLQRLTQRLPLLLTQRSHEHHVTMTKSRRKHLLHSGLQVVHVHSIVHAIRLGGAPEVRLADFRSVSLDSSASESVDRRVTLYCCHVDLPHVDLYELAMELVHFLGVAVDKRVHTAMLWESMLTATDQQLRRRGFAVDEHAPVPAHMWSIAQPLPSQIQARTLARPQLLFTGRKLQADAAAPAPRHLALNSLHVAPQGKYEVSMHTCSSGNVQLDMVAEVPAGVALPVWLAPARVHVLNDIAYRASLTTFSALLSDMLHHVCGVQVNAACGFHVYYDVDSSAVGFHHPQLQCVFLNWRYWHQVHWPQLQHVVDDTSTIELSTLLRKYTAAAFFWLHTLAHERAHEQHSVHGSAHEGVMKDFLMAWARKWVQFAGHTLPIRMRAYMTMYSTETGVTCPALSSDYHSSTCVHECSPLQRV